MRTPGGGGTREPGQPGQEQAHPHCQEQPQRSQAQAACLTQRSPRNWGKGLVGRMPGPDQLRHGAHAAGRAGGAQGMGPQTQGPEGTEPRYTAGLPPAVTGGGATSGTEAWQELTETGVAHFPGCRLSGSFPPMSFQDPGVPYHCAPNPASCGCPRPPVCPLGLPCPNHLASSPRAVQTGCLRNQGTHRTGRDLCQGLRSGQAGRLQPTALACLAGVNLGQEQAGLGGDGERGKDQSQGASSCCHAACSMTQGHLRNWKFRLHRGTCQGPGLKLGPLRGPPGRN